MRNLSLRHPKARIILFLSVVPLLLAFLFLGSKTYNKFGSLDSKHRTGWSQKDLIITYSCSPPPEEPYVKAIADQGYNLLPIAEDALPFAEKYNVKVLLQHGLFNVKTMESPIELEQLNALIDRVKDNPALEGYYIFDEPQEVEFPKLAKLVRHIKARDPHHFCFVNLLPIFGVRTKKIKDPSLIYKDYINEYIRQFKPDLLSYDYYTFVKYSNSPAAGLYFIHLRLMRECARKAELPFMNIIQASQFQVRDWDMPTPAQLRWQVYTSLAYGARAINYFLYWGPKSFAGMYRDGVAIPLVDAAALLNKEMKALSSTLMSMESLYIFQTDPLPPGALPMPFGCPLQITSPGQFVVGVFGEDRKEKAFMIVNRDFSKSVVARVKVLGAEALSELQRSDSSWKTVNPNQNGEFEILLEPGDGRFFKF
ncbi:MAG: hypothetical protein DKT66_25880 [Candidatus Melainabacteria bacterium]|nr:MAG: hypothetical protein DKT66_25880 [Candidatus Melainabacteria bacterium]